MARVFSKPITERSKEKPTQTQIIFNIPFDAFRRFDTIVHFTVVCLVTWPLSGSEAGVDLVLIQTLLLFLHASHFLLMLTSRSAVTSLYLYMKSRRVCINTKSILASIPLKRQVTKHTTVKSGLFKTAVFCNGRFSTV